MLCPCLTPLLPPAPLGPPCWSSPSLDKLESPSQQKLGVPGAFWGAEPGTPNRTGGHQPWGWGQLARAALLARLWLLAAQRRLLAVLVVPVPLSSAGRAEQGTLGLAAGVGAGENGRLLGNIPLELR